MTKQYATANAFRTALEERLKNHSRKTGIDLQRLRRQVAFDRLLFRLFRSFPKDLLLKGGYAMELRLEGARATKDIDLVLKASRVGTSAGQDQAIRRMLQDSVQEDAGDFFEFFVGEPTLDLEAIPYGGSRFPIEAHMDGRLFVRFPIDVVVSSLILDPVEQLESRDWLDFAGIKTMSFGAISPEQQFAEKFHAYTLPRDGNENSRVKDVVDMLLLIRVGKLKDNTLKTAIEKVFQYRETHPLPDGICEPPSSWESVFNRLAEECKIDIILHDAMSEIALYLHLPLINKP